MRTLNEFESRVKKDDLAKGIDEVNPTNHIQSGVVSKHVAHSKGFRCSFAEPTWNPGKIDYEKLIRDFGSTKISDELLERMRKLTVGSGGVLPTNLQWRPPKRKMAEDSSHVRSRQSLILDMCVFFSVASKFVIWIP